MTTSGQAGALIAGRNRLQRPTGGGTWPEEIWQGFDETLNRPVMMRLLPLEGQVEPDLDQQVQSVVAQVARLGHPNIAQVYDVGHEGGLRYVISEWTGGRTLGQIMATGRQPWQRVVDWGQQISEALGALHGIGLVDGVLGPETVSVMDDRRVKLTDVGLGVPQVGADGEATRLISPGFDDQATQMMPPQGLDADATRIVPGGSGSGPFGAANDVYALGAILWTAMVGMPPEVRPEDSAGPDITPLRETGAPSDLAMLLQSMLAVSAPLRPSAVIASHRFGALAIEARETRSDTLPTAVVGATTQGLGGRPTQAVGPLRPRRDEDDEYVPAGAGSGSGGRKAGIAIGVILLLVLAGVALALVLSSKNNTTNTPADTTSVTAPTTSAGQISVSSAPTTSSAAPTTSSAAPTTSSAAPTTTSAAPSTSSAPTTPSASDSSSTATASSTDTPTGNSTSTSTGTSTAKATGGPGNQAVGGAGQ